MGFKEHKMTTQMTVNKAVEAEPRTLSQLLNDLTGHIDGDQVSVKTILEAFQERGFGFFLFLIALPAALPIPALGISTIIALPLMILTFQQAIGRHTVWIPSFLKAKTVSRKRVEGFIKTASPWIKRLEFFTKPRLSFITQGVFSILIGIAGFIMSMAVAIPLPLTNTIPAFGIAVMAIGVLMRDGLAVLVGMMIGTLWVALLAGVTIFLGAEAIDLVKGIIKGFLGMVG